jgi:hypothetical protein
MEEKKITSEIINYIAVDAEPVFEKSLFTNIYWLRFYCLFFAYIFLVE